MSTHSRLNTIRTAAWTLVGALVILFVFFAAIGGVDVAEAWVLSIVVAILAVLWAVHLFLSRRVDHSAADRADRERRGF